MDRWTMEKGIIEFLTGLDLNLNSPHLKNTPKRVVKAWVESFASGYSADIEKILSTQFSADNYDEMVVIKNVPFSSTCAHHLVVFRGYAKIGYIPDKCITGLSKLARVLDAYACRLQTQENLTQEIADAIEKYLKPKGVGVVLEAEHFCMTQRGVRKPGSITVTSVLKGGMKKNAETRAEFMGL